MKSRLDKNTRLKNSYDILVKLHDIIPTNQVKTTRELNKLANMDSRYFTFLYSNKIVYKENKVYKWKSTIHPNMVLANTLLNWLDSKKEMATITKNNKPLVKEEIVSSKKRTFSFLWGLIRFNY